jgi:L-lactate dehydrogenase complex protein LldF
VKINIPQMLIGLRELQHHKKTSRLEAWAYGLWNNVLLRPWLYRVAIRLARWCLRPLSKEGWIRWLPGPGGGWTSARDFPAPASLAFRQIWEQELKDQNKSTRDHSLPPPG